MSSSFGLTQDQSDLMLQYVEIGDRAMSPIDREKILSLGIKKASVGIDRREKVLSQDLAAYKRLRTEGLQPPRVDGSAQLERDAVTPLEIQTGVVKANLPAKERLAMAKRLDSLEFSPARFAR